MTEVISIILYAIVILLIIILCLILYSNWGSRASHLITHTKLDTIHDTHKSMHNEVLDEIAKSRDSGEKAYTALMSFVNKQDSVLNQ